MRVIKACIVTFFVISLTDCVLIVRNLSAASMPANIFQSGDSFTVDENFHPFIVKGFWFAKI